ncbi:MAG: hypothetical protein V4515_07810 [Chloroflexota bacterium]
MTGSEHAAMTFDDLFKTGDTRQDDFADRRVPDWAAQVERVADYASGLFEALW